MEFVVFDYHTDGVFDYEIMFDSEERAKQFGVKYYKGYSIGGMTIHNHNEQPHSCTFGTSSFRSKCVELENNNGIYEYQDRIIVFSNKGKTLEKSGNIIRIKGEL